MSGRVLFVSQNPMPRCENMAALFSAYGGEKEFRCGADSMRTAESEGFAAVVCDCLPARIEGKCRCVSINIGHGMTGGKFYGLDEKGAPWLDPAAYAQTDWAIATSEAGIPIVARQLGMPENRVLAYGMPRTDAYFGKRKGDGGTALSGKTAYLYAPTYRDPRIGGWLPRIDWGEVDNLLNDDEVLVAKRHYFTRGRLVDVDSQRIVEIPPDGPTAPYLIDCDVLLTDYSSVLFDAYVLGKPAVLTIDDMGAYLADRGMYHSYPMQYSKRWLIAEGHEQELVEMLREAARNGMGDTERACRRLTAGACDGRSTERICNLIADCAEGAR